MIVVSDTTPLISLMKMGQLGLIGQLFGEVQIPDAVYDELVSNQKFQSEAQAKCISILRLYGRHISDRLFRQLLDSIR